MPFGGYFGYGDGPSTPAWVTRQEEAEEHRILQHCKNHRWTKFENLRGHVTEDDLEGAMFIMPEEDFKKACLLYLEGTIWQFFFY